MASKGSSRRKIEFTEPIWERQECDTSASWQAFCDYKAMPAPRTVCKLHASYMQISCNQKPPTLNLSTLTSWCARNQWIKRAAAFDARKGAEADKAVIAVVKNKAEDKASKYLDRLYTLGDSRLTSAEDLEEGASEFRKMLSKEALANIATIIEKEAQDAKNIEDVLDLFSKLQSFNESKLFKHVLDMESIVSKLIGANSGATELISLALGIDQALDVAESSD